MGTLTKKEQSTRPPKELIERLRAFTTPELCDGAGLYHSMDYQIKPWICRTKIVGPAITVDVPSGEGDIVADAILELQEGDVLVVAGKGNCDCSCGTAAKSGAGAINVPVSCGGVCVRPGDIVIGDVNGVCVLTQEEAEGVIERALKKIEKQKYTLAEMKRTGQVYTKLLKK